MDQLMMSLESLVFSFPQVLKYDIPFMIFFLVIMFSFFLASESFPKGNRLPGILYYPWFPGGTISQMRWHLKTGGLYFYKQDSNSDLLALIRLCFTIMRYLSKSKRLLIHSSDQWLHINRQNIGDIPPFYSYIKRGSERSQNLFKVTELVYVRPGT